MKPSNPSNPFNSVRTRGQSSVRKWLERCVRKNGRRLRGTGRDDEEGEGERRRIVEEKG